jgi:hypothetical protein
MIRFYIFLILNFFKDSQAPQFIALPNNNNNSHTFVKSAPQNNVNINQSKLTTNEFRTRSPSENSSLASSSRALPPIQHQRKLNDTLNRSTQILNSNNNNSNNQQQQQQIQLFQKINKLQKLQQQATTPPGNSNSTNNLYTDNKRRLSLLLSRKS